MADFKLNKEQKQGIFHKEGPAVVAAVPGSGKTAVLTKRFMQLMAGGVDSSRILCTTFTRKAATEMRDRIRLKMGQMSYIGTLHSILWRVAKKHMPLFFNGITSGEQLELLERNYQKNKILLEALRQFSGISSYQMTDTAMASLAGLGNVLGAIGMLKNYDVAPEDYFEGMKLGPFEFAPPKMATELRCEFIDLYREYEVRKHRNNQIDFDDMLVLSLRLLRENKQVRNEIKDLWDYIMVDEFQDTNVIQWSIIQILAEDHENIFVVGDANQSLYGFRGANPDLIYRFTDFYPGAKDIRMVQNYRSSQPVIDATNNLAATSLYKAGEIVGQGREGVMEYREFHLQSDAAKFVSQYVASRLQIPGVEPRDFAVIYRTNAMSRPYEDALFTADIDYVVKGGDPFYLTIEVQDILTYLSLAIDPETSTMRKMTAIIGKPSRYLGKQFLEALSSRLAAGLTLEAALMSPYPERKNWEPGARMIATQLSELRQIKTPSRAIEYIRKDLDYDGHIEKNKDNPESALAYTEEFQDISSSFMKIDEFLKVMKERIKAAKAKKKERDPNAVSLTTIHSAKGLEFRFVLVTNFYEGSMPHRNATSMDEEQRAVYVAITRAKDECILVYHRTNNFDSAEKSWHKESTFLPLLGLITSEPDEDEEHPWQIVMESHKDS